MKIRVYRILKNIIILGTGGNSIDILDAINEINLISKKYNCIGFLDDDENLHGNIWALVISFLYLGLASPICS